MHIRLKILLKTVWAFFLQIFIRLNGVCHVYNVSVSVFGEVNMRKKPLTESCLMHSLRDFQSRTALPQTRLYLRSETIFYFYLHNQLKFTFARCMHQLLHAKRVYGTNCCFQMLYQSFNSFENQQRLDIWICVALKTHSERDFTAIVCHNMSNCIYVDCTTWHSLKPLSLSLRNTQKRPTINISNFSTLLNFHTSYLRGLSSRPHRDIGWGDLLNIWCVWLPLKLLFVGRQRLVRRFTVQCA